MSGKSVLLSRLGCGLVLLFGAGFALDAWATLTITPPSTVTGTIHYSPMPPALTITAPAAVTTVNTQNLEFKGSLGTAGNLSINGVNVPLAPDHTFDYVAPLSQGPNTISFLGVDLGGNQTTLTRTIDLDTTPPDAPDTGLITVTPVYNGDISVTGAAGSVDPDTQITIVDLNTGVQVTVTSDGSGAFSTTIAAQTGDPIQIIATDPAGNTNDATAQVPAMITITSSTLTADEDYTLTGILNSAATVTVNNLPATMNDLNFTAPVLLAQGDNKYTVVATDSVTGDQYQTVADIFLDNAPPTITITGPAGAYTNQSHITITGSVSFLSPSGTLEDGTGHNIPLTSTNTFSYPVIRALQSGLNSFTFFAVDQMGNPGSQTWSITLDTTPPVIDVPLISAVDVLDGSGNPTGEATITGAAGAISDDSNTSVSVTVTSVGSGQSAPAMTTDATGAFSASLHASAEAPFNIVATDQAGNSEALRVQFGTSCYSDSSTLDTQLTVADGSGMVTGPIGGTALFHITRSGELNFDTYVDYQTGQASDTAVSGTDYTGGTGSFKIPAGVTDADLSIPLLDSNGGGTDKTFTLRILGVHNVVGTSGNLALGSCVTPVSVTGTEHFNIIPPVITVTGPSATTFESPYQVVTGSVTAAAGETATLTVDGATTTINPDNTFNGYITLRPGTNNYSLVATDASGNTVTLVETYTLNSPSLPAPVGTLIQFQSPPGSGSVTITGQPGAAYPGATVTVTDVTDGQSNSGTADADGSFSVVVQGNASDQFEVVISTTDGQQSTPVFAHGDDAPLTISVTSPVISQSCGCATVVGNTVNIIGTYTGPTNTGITVNSVPAQVINGSFFVNNLPLVPGTANTVNIIATAPGGSWTATTVTVNSTAPTSTLVLTATSADTGMAPLAMTFNYSFQGTTPQIQTVEMSYLGTCNSSISGCTYDVNSNDPGVALSYTYLTPGIYPATLTLIDTNGNSYQATLNVVVQDRSAVDAAIRKIWGDFTSALSKGNRAAAMSGLDYTAQQQYAPVFDTLLPQMQQIVSNFSPMMGGSISNGVAEYNVVRIINGQAQVFFISFILDNNGVWRVDGM